MDPLGPTALPTLFVVLGFSSSECAAGEAHQAALRAAVCVVRARGFHVAFVQLCLHLLHPFNNVAQESEVLRATISHVLDVVTQFVSVVSVVGFALLSLPPGQVLGSSVIQPIVGWMGAAPRGGALRPRAAWPPPPFVSWCCASVCLCPVSVLLLSCISQRQLSFVVSLGCLGELLSGQA